MSLKGTQPVRVVGSQAVLNPPACNTNGATTCTQGAVAGFDNRARAMAGFKPEGRKKFTSDAGTNGPPGPTPQPFCDSGLSVGSAAPAAIAACQFFSSRSPRVVLALMGRFIWRPPLKLYATLKDMLCPRSCSKVRFACCA